MTGILEPLAISVGVSLLTAGVTYALTPTQKIQGNRLNDLSSPTSSYGAPLPVAWGTVRLPGNKIWLDYKEEVRKKKKQGKVETTTFQYYGYYASVYCHCPFRPIVRYQRTWMNKKLVYSTVGGAETIAEGGKFAEQYLRFYRGLPAQAIDPLLANTDPISNYSYGLPSDPAERDAYLRNAGIDPSTAVLTPAYNGRAYIVAQRIPLEDFFNSLPSDESEIVASENCTVGQIVGDIFGLFLKPERFDVSLLTTPVKGFSLDTVEAAKSALQTLQQAYFFDIVDSNGVYKFVPLNNPRDVVNLSAGDLGARIVRDRSGSQDYEITETDPATLPSSVIVKYIDRDLNYDVNQVESALEVKRHYNPNPVTLTFNLVLSPSEAATIADRALILAWVQKYTYKFQLPPKYLALEPGDLIPNLFDDRGAEAIKLTQTRIGANLVIDCEGVPHDIYFWNLERLLEQGGITLGVADYNVTIVTSGRVDTVGDTQGNVYTEGVDYRVNNSGIEVLSSGNIPQGTELVVATATEPTPTNVATIVSAGDTELLVLDIPLIDNEDPDYTLYLAASGSENWTGASIYFSTDNSRYVYLTNIETKSVFGECLSDLSEDKLTVRLNSADIESITDSDLALGFNLALAGNQIIQFKNALVVDFLTYELSQITTGLRGTETQPRTVAGDNFVLLRGESAEVTDIVMNATNINQTLYFKALSNGQALATVEPVEITYQAIAQRPYAPTDLTATKNGVGDITISWDRRDRHLYKKNPPILSEEEEKYVVQIMNSSAVVVATAIVNSSSYIYTAADQKADLKSVATTITVKVAQVSSDVGNGSFATATLTPVRVEPPPTLISFTPASATVGATVGITGNNLATVNRVEIDGVAQNNLAVSNNSLVSFVVSPPSNSGLITVYTLGGSATSANALVLENFKSKNTLVFGDRALNASDNNKILDCQSNGVIVLTLDKALVESGFQTTVRKKGTGDIMLQIIEGDTLEAVGNKIIKQYTAAYVSYFGSGVWIALGAL